MLGELADRLSEFRLAETYRAVALYPKTRAEAESLAEEQRHVIEKLQDEYVTLLGDKDAHASIVPVRVAWRAYEAAHDAWITADIDGAFNEPARHDSSLHRLYKVADVAVDPAVGRADGSEAKIVGPATQFAVDPTNLLLDLQPSRLALRQSTNLAA